MLQCSRTWDKSLFSDDDAVDNNRLDRRILTFLVVGRKAVCMFARSHMIAVLSIVERSNCKMIWSVLYQSFLRTTPYRSHATEIQGCEIPYINCSLLSFHYD